MSKYIEKDALKMAFRTRECAEKFGHSIYRLFFVDKVIDAQPSVDAVPVVHGRWKEADDGDGAVCSVCGEDFCNIYLEVERFNHCPNCGALMDLEESNV